MSDELLHRALERHRDDDPPRLDFSVPLDRLMDVAHCKTLAQDLEHMGPDGWEIVKATPTAWRRIPSVAGIYMFVWQPAFGLRTAASARRTTFPWVLYVGSAGDGSNKNTLKARYKGEYARLVGSDPEVLWSGDVPTSREDRLGRFLSITPLQYWYCAIEDRAEIRALEKRLFALFAPPLNSAGSPRLRPVGKASPAF